MGDVLYVSVRPRAKHTRNLEEEVGLVLRYAKGVPVGATILDYKNYWVPQRQRLTKRLSDFFGIPERAVTQIIREAD